MQKDKGLRNINAIFQSWGCAIAHPEYTPDPPMDTCEKQMGHANNNFLQIALYVSLIAQRPQKFQNAYLCS